MGDVLFVLNAGSSSLKFAIYRCGAGGLNLDARGQIKNLGAKAEFTARDSSGRIVGERSWTEDAPLGHAAALSYLLSFIRSDLGHDHLIGVGHRVTHGGRDFGDPVRLDESVIGSLASLAPLAPLHQPWNLEAARQLLREEPGLPQVACFDTAFHRTNAEVTRHYAIPAELYTAGVQRYGFHGLSYEYIASVLPALDARAAEGRTVVMHLGSGASLCALAGGRSVASTMEFTPLDGVPMSTRCGGLDPGVILYLMNERRMDAGALETLLYEKSGLLGLSGVSGDVQTLLTSNAAGARLALDVQVYGIRRALGSLAAALGGLDAIVFTAGIGENSAVTRARICEDAAWLGVKLDEEANAAAGAAGKGGAQRVSRASSGVSVWVIPTDEELMIARHTLALISGDSAPQQSP